MDGYVDLYDLLAIPEDAEDEPQPFYPNKRNSTPSILLEWFEAAANEDFVPSRANKKVLLCSGCIGYHPRGLFDAAEIKKSPRERLCKGQMRVFSPTGAEEYTFHEIWTLVADYLSMKKDGASKEQILASFRNDGRIHESQLAFKIHVFAERADQYPTQASIVGSCRLWMTRTHPETPCADLPRLTTTLRIRGCPHTRWKIRRAGHGAPGWTITELPDDNRRSTARTTGIARKCVTCSENSRRAHAVELNGRYIPEADLVPPPSNKADLNPTRSVNWIAVGMHLGSPDDANGDDWINCTKPWTESRRCGGSNSTQPPRPNLYESLAAMTRIGKIGALVRAICAKEGTECCTIELFEGETRLPRNVKPVKYPISHHTFESSDDPFQIARLEHCMGRPLPADLDRRALIDVHPGVRWTQQEVEDEVYDDDDFDEDDYALMEPL